MSNILEQLKREGSIALWHDYQLGHANDLSGNGNDGVLVNSPWFDRNGLNTTYLGNQAVQVAHSASINLTTFSVAALVGGGRIAQRSSGPQIARKQDAVGYSWSFRLTESTNNVGIDSSVGTRNWVPTRALPGFNLISCNIETGNANTPLYLDGVLEDAALNGAPGINQSASALFIGNIYLLNGGFGRAISSFILFNKLLSATEHAQVYGELMKTRRRILV